MGEPADDVEWSEDDLILTVRVAVEGDREERVRTVGAWFYQRFEMHGMPAMVTCMTSVRYLEEDDDG